jgi:D-alanyl-D-alanine carboxypeptidase
MLKNLFICAVLLTVSYPVFSTNILAKSWLIADGDGNILESENIEVKQPIASMVRTYLC